VGKPVYRLGGLIWDTLMELQER